MTKWSLSLVVKRISNFITATVTLCVPVRFIERFELGF